MRSDAVTCWSRWYGLAAAFVRPVVSVNPSLWLDAMSAQKLALDYTNVRTAGAAISLL